MHNTTGIHCSYIRKYSHRSTIFTQLVHALAEVHAIRTENGVYHKPARSPHLLPQKRGGNSELLDTGSCPLFVQEATRESHMSEDSGVGGWGIVRYSHFIWYALNVHDLAG
jgi:hypothetical protein